MPKNNLKQPGAFKRPERAFRNGSSEHKSLEVFDDKGKLLMLMPQENILKQKLRCRMVLVAIKDRDERVLLCKYTEQHSTYPKLWDISASGYLLPGESFLDAALRAVTLRFMHSEKDFSPAMHIQPSPENNNRELALFRNRPGFYYPQIRSEGEVHQTMFVDEEELTALLREMPEFISPDLRLAVEYIFR